MAKRRLHLSERRSGADAKATPLRDRAPPAAPPLEPAATPAPPDGSASLSAREREEMIAQEAYYRAERRGFVPGDELGDWLAAEQDVERLLTSGSTLLS
jgi:hypothetical protein